jgi:multimeric flavodoxin WrbA
VTLEAIPTELRTSDRWDFSGLRALYVNCTLKPSPERSHTQGLIDLSSAIMAANGVAVEEVRAVDHELAPGVWPDMRDHGAERDEWPALYERVQAADILVLCSPIWLGEKSSVCTRVVERLYGNSSLLNEHGQYAYYGKVAGWIGEAGPGPSYLDEGSGGPENDFTNRNTTFMTWNLMHLARMLHDAGGMPAHGNQRSLWDAGCRWDLPNPEHR